MVTEQPKTEHSATEATTENQSIGLIGIGLLGTALAERLLSAGYSVLGYDPTPEGCERLVSLGGYAASDVAQVARETKCIFFSLPDSNVVASVLAEIDEQLAGVQSIIDTTTGAPEASIEAAKKLHHYGGAYLDATIAGSSEQTRRGESLVLVGGSQAAYIANEDLLACIAAKRFYVGPSGSGAKMKLVVNLAIGLNRAVMAEALALGTSFGFDAAEVLDVLRASPGHSRMMDTKGAKMVGLEFSPQARLRQHLKDVRLMLDAGEQNSSKLPLSNLHAEILQSLVDDGFGDEDNSAVFRYFI